MEETSMDEFFAEMDEDYQSDSVATEETSAEETEPVTDDTAQEGAEAPSTEENSGNADEPSAEEKPTESEQEPRTYVLRVNHEDKTVTHEELMNYAQMGVDYSRVKSQLEQVKNDNSGLSAKVAEMQVVVDAVSELAAASDVSVEELLNEFAETRYKSLGYSNEAAKLAVERDRLKKERDSLQNQAKPSEEQTRQERIKQDIADFQQKHPDVPLSEQLVSKLIDDVTAGMSLADAYIKMQMDELKKQNEELSAQLAAEKQNAANMQSSPGSVSDTGTKRKRDQFDDFFDAY